MMGVESQCENWVSQVEVNLTPVRGLLSQERIEDEVKDEMILLMKSVLLLPNIGNLVIW